MSDTRAAAVTAVGLRVDRASHQPLHQQLAEQLRDAIAHGRLAPGTQLVSETEMAERTGLSRITIRHAVRALTAEGLLVRRRGVGTYVAHAPLDGAVDLTSFHDDLRATERHRVMDLLRTENVPASAEVAVALAVPEGSTVVRLERLQRDGGAVAAYLRHYLPLGGFRPNAEHLASAGLYAAMQAVGITVRSVQQSIGARNATAGESELLGITEGSAILTMRRTLFDGAGRAVEYATHCYPASRRTWAFELCALPEGENERRRYAGDV
ncbi:GntR family transcriptional regulator [Streptomyces spinoverrucosus]|uniref:GntR family transcriptional regulator n=1 Tax=Streptomyces spinoverrucosus TaxID=284043 RepID=UPI0018C449D1|nr:GntR family transcriptional regulator [Streptomyces spinoverrucosus]MBG0855765.1 GntR family transcriptional regulator [Streptomyces spinoverrucosus]